MKVEVGMLKGELRINFSLFINSEFRIPTSAFNFIPLFPPGRRPYGPEANCE